MVYLYRKSVCIIAKKEDKFILVKNRKWEKDLWKFPQGGIKSRETISEAAKREFKEELKSKKISIISISRKRYKYLWTDEFRKSISSKYSGQDLCFVVAEFKGDKLVCNKKEIEKYKFVDVDELFNFKYLDYGDTIIGALTESNVKRISRIDFPDNFPDVNLFFKKLKFSLVNINNHHNSINGIIKKENKKYFFKVGPNNEISREIGGYLLLIGKYPVPKINEIIFLKSKGLIIFEHEKSVKNNAGTLCDYLNDGSHKIELAKIKNVFRFYKSNLKNTLKRNNFPMNDFFAGRIDSRIFLWYLKNSNPLFRYEIIINKKSHGNLLSIINKTVVYFNKKHRLTCFLSQGDPTQRNICMKPLFFDFKTSGYNPAVGEISIFYWNMALGNYFNLKYNPGPYSQSHTNALKNLKKYEPEMEYQIDNVNKQIEINLKFSQNSKIRTILMEYFNLFNKELFRKEINADLQYFLVLRVVGRFNILEMDEKDKILSFSMACLFFQPNTNYLNKILSLL